ncbi:MAG: radical SAM protein [Elusimicrobiota bacterium]
MTVVYSFLKKQGVQLSQTDMNEIIHSYNKSSKTKLNFQGFYGDIVKIKDRRVFIKIFKKPAHIRLADKAISLLDLDENHIVGFSIVSKMELYSSILLSNRIKKLYKNIKIVFGGPLINSIDHKFLYQFRAIDYMISGAGEVPFFKLLEYLRESRGRLDDIPGLTYRKDAAVKRIPAGYWPIDDQCAPDLEGLNFEYYQVRKERKRISYSLSFGCFRSCSFCGHQKLFTRKYQTKNIKKVIYELEWLSNKYNTNMYNFCSSCIDRKYLNLLCDSLIDRNLNIKWNMSINPADIDSILLEKMYRSGCRDIEMGIESGSDKVLSMMGKGFKIGHANNMIKRASNMGINIIVHILVGYPYETRCNFQDTLNFIKSNRNYVKDYILYRFCLLSASPMYCSPAKYRIKILDPVDIFRNMYMFDEIRGLKYPAKKNTAKIQIY